MKATLEYIDDVIDKAVEARKANIALSEAEKSEAKLKSRKLVAGFRVFDAQEEKRHLDLMVAKRMASIEAFLKDRKAIKEGLAKLGITPLAAVPTKAWTRICRDAGLYILNPDKQNHVRYSTDFIGRLTARQKANFEYLAKKDQKWFLDQLFPNGVSLPSTGGYYNNNATLILPDPPADVAEILVRASDLSLRVAAVAEAISFVETPTQILNNASVSSKDLWAQAQGYADYKDWVKRDPIIFTEAGSATAIIAQFGEFPIEKAVVDAAIASNDLLPEGISPQVATVQIAATTSSEYMQMQYNQLRMMQSAYFNQGVTVPIDNTMVAVPMTVQSNTWTGRF